ncbi:MAG TPA: serine hydrolase domain-containing protein [Longimicrobium sp.]|nr:serine hydrolase domain-containing protein [Longimicrobium sp.]
MTAFALGLSLLIAFGHARPVAAGHPEPRDTMVGVRARHDVPLQEPEAIVSAPRLLLPDPAADSLGLHVAAALDTLVRRRMAADSVPGVALAFVRGGRVHLASGYGWADAAARRAMTDSTPVNVASVSKPVTAWAVVRGAAGLFRSLDEEVVASVEDSLELGGTGAAHRATVRQLLSHTAGFGMPSVPCPPLDSARPRTVDALRGAFGDRGPLTVVHPPGERWAYSGGGYTLLQRLVERRSGAGFEGWAKRTLFEPWGLRDATFDPAAGRVARPHDGAGRPMPPFRCVGEAAGGLYLSARDAARILLQYAPADGAASAELFSGTAPVSLPGVDTGGARYGLGHFVWTTPEGERIVFHSGGNPGTIAFLAFNLDAATGIFFVTNSERGLETLRAVVARWAALQAFAPPPVF